VPDFPSKSTKIVKKRAFVGKKHVEYSHNGRESQEFYGSGTFSLGTDGNPFLNSKTYRYEFYGRLVFLERASLQMQQLLWKIEAEATKATFMCLARSLICIRFFSEIPLHSSIPKK
jgi:hypothetical protein